MSDSILLNYDDPPIVEVVAAVSFEALPPGALVHFGAFWHGFLAEAFPRVEEKTPYVPPIERFGSEVLAPQISMLNAAEFPSPRLWALSANGDEVLQLQRNWFACNWRMVSADAAYTHWPARRRAFLKWYSSLDKYLRDAGIGPISPVQCEVTYINHITPGGTWKKHGELSRIFRAIGESSLPDNLERESTRFGQDLLMIGSDGRPSGRLHVNAQPAFRTENREPIYVLELTARGVPASKEIEGVIDFLDHGRNTIVRTFEAITSDEIQREWGKK